MNFLSEKLINNCFCTLMSSFMADILAVFIGWLSNAELGSLCPSAE